MTEPKKEEKDNSIKEINFVNASIYE